jgi:CRP-like cAMP-binding protein
VDSQGAGIAAAEPAAFQAAAWVLACLGDRRPAGEQAASRLAVRLQFRQLAPGEVAFARGQRPSGVWLVRSGSLELSTGSGRRRVVVGVLAPCGIAGDVPLLLGCPAVCTARALTTVQAVFLPSASFLTLFDEYPVLARSWLVGLACRHARAQEALAGTVSGSAQGRVARLLLRESRQGQVTCSQSTLTAMAGVRRPTLNQVLKQFERQGLLRVGYRQVTLLSPEGLQAHAVEPMTR